MRWGAAGQRGAVAFLPTEGLARGCGLWGLPGVCSLWSRAVGGTAGGRQTLAPRPAGAELLMESWWSSGACRDPAQAGSGVPAAPFTRLQWDGAGSLLPRRWLPASAEESAMALAFVLPARDDIGGFAARRQQSLRFSRF